MNERKTPLEQRIQRQAHQTGMLLAGMGLLVLAGMNLFTNLLQLMNGQWKQNVGISLVLMLFFAVVPAWFGVQLVFRAAGPANRPSPPGGDR